MTQKWKDKNIDTFNVAFYLGEQEEDSVLVVLRNKKVVNEIFGKNAIKLYKLLNN